MKNKFWALVLLGSFVIPQLSFASCEDAYRAGLDDLEKPWRESSARKKAIAKDAFAISVNAPSAVLSTAAATADLGTPGGGSMAIVFLGMGAVSAGDAVDASIDISKQKNPVDAIADMRASLDLLVQANAGDGNELRALTKEINNKCTHEYDQPFTVEMISQIIVNLDNRNTFCPQKDNFYELNAIKRSTMNMTRRLCN